MSRTNDPMGMATAAMTFLLNEIGLGWPGVQKFLERVVDEKPGKVGYAPGAGATPILTESFGTTDLGESRFSIRFDWRIGEVFTTKGPSEQGIIYPPMIELASGTSLGELVGAINKHREPWIVMRNTSFLRTLFPSTPEGVEAHSRFHQVDPVEWWTKNGVTDEAAARMRPGGPLWRDMTEDVGGGSKWVLLGVE